MRITSVNVNGVRAACRKGFLDWLAEAQQDRPLDILALQEVRAPRKDLEALFAGPDSAGRSWQVEADECSQPGRAGVAILSRQAPVAVRKQLDATLNGEPLDTTGRWLEADFQVEDREGQSRRLTVVSCYVFAGQEDTVKQQRKMAFLDRMVQRMAQLRAQDREPADGGDGGRTVVVGDFNVGHRKLDIKNWKGNLKKSGFLPEERAHFDLLVGGEDDPEYNRGGGQGWIDVGRRAAGEVEGIYTWWSMRGQAFDNDTGWRIDYHYAHPALVENLGPESYRVSRQPSYAERWSDHAPVSVDYRL